MITCFCYLPWTLLVGILVIDATGDDCRDWFKPVGPAVSALGLRIQLPFMRALPGGDSRQSSIPGHQLLYPLSLAASVFSDPVRAAFADHFMPL